MFKNERIYKLISKTRINDLLYNLLRRKYLKSRDRFGNSTSNIEELRPDSFSSCIVNRNKTWLQWDYDLDIIVPVFNVGNMLETCINSVIQQKTQYDFKLIIVNDGSTDNKTLEILDKYKNINNILICNKENGGVSSARNYGLSLSKGKYLMFLDADDLLYVGAIQKMLEIAETESADIVEASYNNFEGDNKVIKCFPQKEGVLSGQSDMYGYPWGKVFKRNIFYSIQFPEYYFEDSIIKTIVYPSARRMIGISEYYFGYRRNHNSLSFTSQGNSKSLDSFWISKQIQKDRATLGMDNGQDYYEYMLNIIKLTFRRNIHLSNEYHRDLFNRWIEIMKEFDGYSTNNKSFKDLELSIRTNNFGLYSFWNKMKMFS